MVSQFTQTASLNLEPVFKELREPVCCRELLFIILHLQLHHNICIIIWGINYGYLAETIAHGVLMHESADG